MFRFVLLLANVLSFNLNGLPNNINLVRRAIVTNIPFVAGTIMTKDSQESNVEIDSEMFKINSIPRNIYFYGDVSVESCAFLSRRLVELEEVNKIKPINIYIQSFGGDLLATFNVIDTIERIKCPIYSYVDGYAASAATLISVSCNKRFMGKRSLMLIHQLSGGSEGTYGYMKQEMDNMDIYMEFAREIYLKHTKLNNNLLSDILKYDNKWMNSTLCLEYGLVDKIL
tara:strand:+ start:3690 stop:4370 length:681 start_codon:yes stop_codon:yes gene_type:complete